MAWGRLTRFGCLAMKASKAASWSGCSRTITGVPNPVAGRPRGFLVSALDMTFAVPNKRRADKVCNHLIGPNRNRSLEDQVMADHALTTPTRRTLCAAAGGIAATTLPFAALIVASPTWSARRWALDFTAAGGHFHDHHGRLHVGAPIESGHGPNSLGRAHAMMAELTPQRAEAIRAIALFEGWY